MRFAFNLFKDGFRAAEPQFVGPFGVGSRLRRWLRKLPFKLDQGGISVESDLKIV